MKRLIVLLSALLLAVMPVQAKAQEQGDVTAKCYTEAVRRMDGNNSHVRTEIDRVHREAARDRHHAFGRVEITGPNPWKRGTGLTI